MSDAIERTAEVPLTTDDAVLIAVAVRFEDRKADPTKTRDELRFFVMAALEQPKHSAGELFFLKPAKRVPKVALAFVPDNRSAQVAPVPFVVFNDAIGFDFIRYRSG
jgi:hypothetical protein